MLFTGQHIEDGFVIKQEMGHAWAPNMTSTLQHISAAQARSDTLWAKHNQVTQTTRL